MLEVECQVLLISNFSVYKFHHISFSTGIGFVALSGHIRFLCK